MNPRIRELAEQAEISRLEYNPYTMMTERIQEFDKQKFAELIIEDACRALNPMLRDMISRGQAVELIKKTFWS